MSDPNETAETAPTVPRDTCGRVLAGNALAKGHGGGARDLARYRKLCRENTSDEEMLAAWATLKRLAIGGEAWALHELLDRLHGKAAQPEPDKDEGLGEILAREYQRWMLHPSEVEMAELEAENARLRAAAPPPALPAPLPVQQLVPGRIASVGVREVAIEKPALERQGEEQDEAHVRQQNLELMRARGIREDDLPFRVRRRAELPEGSES